MRRLAGVLISLILLVSLASCSGGAASESTAVTAATSAAVTEPRQFVLPRTLSTLHPILGNERTNLALSPLLWEGLFELDNTFTTQNVLCESYTVSTDGLIWTFTLRDDVTFSDGSPLTADEAAWSLQLAMGTGSRYERRLSCVKSAAASGDHTLTVTLSAPNGSLPALLDIPIVKGESEEPLGTGPYAIEGSGDDTRLMRRSDWWQNKSLPIEAIPLRTVDGGDSLIYAFDTNDVSLVTTDLTGTNALGYSIGYEAWDCPTTVMLFVGFNTAKGACSDPLIRQALSHAFDRTTIATALLARHAVPAVLPVSPSSPLYDADLASQLDYSTQTSADLLAQAGYTLADGALKKDRAQLALTLLVNSENSFKSAAADYLAKELGSLGIAVELKKLAWTDYQKALVSGNFDLYLGEIMLTADFDLTELIASGGALNYGRYGNSYVSSLLSSFRASDSQTRAAAASALYRKLGEDMPFTPLCFKCTSVLTQWGTMSGLSPTQNNAFFGLSDWKSGSHQ